MQLRPRHVAADEDRIEAATAKIAEHLKQRAQPDRFSCHPVPPIRRQCAGRRATKGCDLADDGLVEHTLHDRAVVVAMEEAEERALVAEKTASDALAEAAEKLDLETLPVSFRRA